MQCPSRVAERREHYHCDQNPSALAAHSTTQQYLNSTGNLRVQTDCERHSIDRYNDAPSSELASQGSGMYGCGSHGVASRCLRLAKTYIEFVGPGFLVSVAYIDPGNYSTAVAAGAAFQYKLLFTVLLSNIFAIFLQSLCVKLGTVTGMNLAQMCGLHMNRWPTFLLYILSEAAIIATDIAEVIGTAIALNLLTDLPLVAGCAVSVVEVLLILVFYRPWAPMSHVRIFEGFVAVLVLAVMICSCIELSMLKNTTAGEVLRGYLPSSAVIRSEGLYQSCGILGATVMPHSLFLGSGVVQSRLWNYDIATGVVDRSSDVAKYRPSLTAIRGCLRYSVVELVVSLCSFALFINSAILIIAGASLFGTNDSQSGDLFGIYDLLNHSLASAAGTIYALALLLSGISAGVVCTMAGQMVSEGMLNWTVAPWVRRLVTRSIAIVPSIIIAASIGKDGLTTALNATQVVLSVVLPFVSAPLIYFTCRTQYMTVEVPRPSAEAHEGATNMRNSWLTTAFAVVVWVVITALNAALLVLVGMGKA